jgi:hypothetical protein
MAEKKPTVKQPTMDELEQALLKSYDKKTAHRKYKGKWTPENPAYGQCVPTSLLVQHFYGGEIYKHKDHYYNFIDGEFVDLSASQLKEPFDYPAGKPKQPALEQSQTLERFKLLKERVERHLTEAKRSV